MLEHVVHSLLGWLPGWAKPLLFAPTLITGREQASVVANGVGWNWAEAALAAAVVFTIYAPVAGVIFSKVKPLHKTTPILLAGPLWLQWLKIAVAGMVPTIGFPSGAVAVRSSPDRQVLKTALVAGGVASFSLYKLVIGAVIALPLVPSLLAVTVLAIVLMTYHRRTTHVVQGLG